MTEDRGARGGRHRRGRGLATGLATSPHDGVVASVSRDDVPAAPQREDAEPLFTRPPVEPEAEPEVEPVIDLTSTSRTRTVFDPPPSPRSSEPFGDAGSGLLGSFRRWWREESHARAARKRAFATAEAILRAQAAQEAGRPVEKAPSAESYTQALRGVMTLTEERFQSLGLGSERLRDEVRGISRTVDELHAVVLAGGLEGVAPAATRAIGTLEERFDTLLVALSEEIGRRSEETNRRLSEQLATQTAELATLLESGVERIRAAVPDAMRAVVPEEMATLREAIPQELRRGIGAVIPEEMERLREHQRTELDRVLNVAQKQLEVMRSASDAELERIRRTIPQALGDLLPDEIDRVREAVAAELERVREEMPEALERAGVGARVAEVATRELERLRRETSEQLDRIRWAIPDRVERAVIARMGAITSADPAQGEDAEPR